MKQLLLSDLHSGTIHSPYYTCLFALLMEKIFELLPLSPGANILNNPNFKYLLHIYNSQISCMCVNFFNDINFFNCDYF